MEKNLRHAPVPFILLSLSHYNLVNEKTIVSIE